MKEYIFNEQMRTEMMMEHGWVDPNNIVRTINSLVRYNFYVLQLEAAGNYAAVNEYMSKNSDIYTEVGYYTRLNSCIKRVEKKSWHNISEIIITKSELEIIRSLKDDRKEKIAFVLLADAKYDRACTGHEYSSSFLSMSDIYKLARVSMPRADRARFLSFLVSEGLINENLNPKLKNRDLTYVNDDDDAELVLTESNYKELAFTYMNWKYGGYKECKTCGVLFKPRGGTLYCKDCTPLSTYCPIGEKTITCADCGIEITVPAKDNNTVRCADCRREYIKAYDRERKKIRRAL